MGYPTLSYAQTAYHSELCREEHVGGTLPNLYIGVPKGITFMFHVKHFFRYPLGLVGVPDLPYSV